MAPQNLALPKICRSSKFDTSRNLSLPKIYRSSKFDAPQNLMLPKICRFPKFVVPQNLMLLKIVTTAAYLAYTQIRPCQWELIESTPDLTPKENLFIVKFSNLYCISAKFTHHARTLLNRTHHRYYQGGVHRL